MRRRHYSFLAMLCLGLLSGTFQASAPLGSAQGPDPRELPVRKVGTFASAAEAYFSPDGKQLIVTARMPDHENHNVYIMNIDGTNIRRITNKGRDACAYFSSDGKHIVFSSDRDNEKLPPGDYADAANYPPGSEVYIANVDGTDIKRLTFNTAYDAETSFSPDGKWILYTSNVDGNLELYRMTLDGKTKFRITHTPDLQEGGAFYMPDGKRIIFRAWKKGEDANKNRVSQLYLINADGTGLVQLTDTQQFNWSPYPSPDGKHVVFAHRGTGDFEIYMLDIETKKVTRLTYHPKFDSYPVFSPDGKTLAFTSNRDGAPAIYLMDLTPLLVGEQGGKMKEDGQEGRMTRQGVADPQFELRDAGGKLWRLVDFVDGTGDVGLHTSLSCDPSCNPAINYYDRTIDDLKLARWDGLTWNVQTVESVGTVELWSSRAFDLAGNPAISYFGDGTLKFAWWSGRSWTIQAIDSNDMASSYTSLGFHLKGGPEISPFDLAMWISNSHGFEPFGKT